MDDLAVLHVPAGDGRELPSYLFCGSKDIDPRCFHARAHQVHVPALPPQALVDDPFALLGHALLAEDTRVAAEPERLVEPVVEGGLLDEVDGGVHPEDQVCVKMVEVLGDVVRPEGGVTGDAVEAEEEAGLVFPYHGPGLGRCRGIRGASEVLGVSLAPEPALEPDPVGDDDLGCRDGPGLSAF